MSQMKQLSYSWVKNYLSDNKIDEIKLQQSFGLAATYRGLLEELIQRELAKLEKDSSLSKLATKPNRAELLLAYQAKREALKEILSYIVDE